ncbi:MAG: tRNA (adenosine(37)-N6)-threonylcarbamoyltransferase complex dimerization subunit type 1 TsaB [Treponema sp.]|nr:tRNA (adenosine(37)-N6)-threonylcarbamoyltransferase complex dimerization subunit type 1 TsaB [Treponema sp.]
MKALAIDGAATCIYISAKNDDHKVDLSLNLGQKQSQKLLPAIDYVLSQIELKPSELDYMTLTSGPGTFTGLRLAFSALKAIELAFNVPIYPVPSLDAYAYPYRTFDGQIVSVIDAKKDQFFAALYSNGKTVHEAEDTSAENIAKNLDPSKKILLCGPDAKIFAEELSKINPDLKLTLYSSQPSPSQALFDLSEEMIEQKKEPLADYDGPIYLRKSEAEIKLEKDSQN